MQNSMCRTGRADTDLEDDPYFLIVGSSLTKAWLLAALTLWFAPIAQGAAQPSGSVYQNIRYVFTSRDQAPVRQQSLDLYVPSGAKGKLPLVAFVHGGFWRESDDKY